MPPHVMVPDAAPSPQYGSRSLSLSVAAIATLHLKLKVISEVEPEVVVPLLKVSDVSERAALAVGVKLVIIVLAAFPLVPAAIVAAAV